MNVTEGMLLWQPSEQQANATNVAHYMRWLDEQKGLRFETYDDLWHWSVENLEDFWASMWGYFDVKAAKPYQAVLGSREMPGAEWFPGAELNYVDQVFRHVTPERPAIIFRSETVAYREVGWAELERLVASVAAAFRGMGLSRGDRVAAFMPTTPESVIAFLACASIGAVWSSCSPDFGTASVTDRFKQIDPALLIVIDGYRYGGKAFDKMAEAQELRGALPSLRETVLLPYLDPQAGLDGARPWGDLLGDETPLQVDPVPFDHPLWVLYTSGTTGLPKPIVHGHGGIVLEHLKVWAFHLDLKPEDRFFWFTTTGWAMWNLLTAGLLLGSTIVQYDGSLAHPSLDALWSYAEDAGITVLGSSAAYMDTCAKEGIHPVGTHDLSCIRTVGSTGSPLSPDGFKWVYDNIGKDVWLVSTSGGTDVCTPFVGGCPILPVRAGELQCRQLGVKVEAWNEEGKPVIDEVGELVVTEPMPSMPLYFWNDPGDARYRESYFEMFPGVWQHGDWIKINGHGSAVIYGRSDSTINRMGVRIGTSEIYAAVEDLPEVTDSLVVDLEGLGGASYMPLFVVLAEEVTLDDALEARIKNKIRARLSPRQVPDVIIEAPEVPRTLNGKKLEVPVRRLLMGVPRERCLNLDSMLNPGSIAFFEQLVGKVGPRAGG